jgi:hypothetical protein
MAGANSNIQMTELDFNAIKNNLKTYLQSQDTLKDYNYDGSALSVLLDVLAYNTQYNAYYLNMIGNEMFLDTAIQRNSVVSQAKLLNYVPKSAIAPTATVTLTVNQVTDSSLTMPKFTSFMSEAVDGVNYTFVTTDAETVNVVNNRAVFSNVAIRQGTPTSMSYVVDSSTNPSYTFRIPNTNIDTTTLQVGVQTSATDNSYQIYDLASNYLTVENDSTVYFLQEGMNNYYEIYFGNGVLGKKLTNGNIVRLTYLTTSGTSAYQANSFVLMDSINGYSNTITQSITAATQGSAKESIDSIKFHAPKSYAAQKRAVTKEDYITAIQQNKLGYSFDAVNVWGGQENSTPVYGQVFISVKPSGAYTLTDTQKQKMINDIIKPISVMTVEPTLVDPDYTYIQITANVLYDAKKTTYTSGQIQSLVKTAISNLAASSLNTFNSTFKAADFNNAINNVDKSIITNEISLQLQKKFLPILTNATTYNLYYGAELKRGINLSGVNSFPSVSFRNPSNIDLTIDNVYLDEMPAQTGGVESITVLNPGFGYSLTSPPTATILGDGTGATATVTLDGKGSIESINVTNAGTGYTSAIVKITNSSSDTTGSLGAAVVTLQGRYGTIRTYYNNTQNVKTLLNLNAGTIDYQEGILTLNSFAPLGVDNDLGQLTVSVNPATTILSSSYNRIITVDPFDSNAIIVNVTAK